MVDITHKTSTLRIATAQAIVKVGKSGNENNRFAEVVAKAFNFPALINVVVDAALTIEKGISPEIRPVWDDPAPLDGTFTIDIPARR